MLTLSCTPGSVIHKIPLTEKTKFSWHSVKTDTSGHPANIAGYELGMIRIGPETEDQRLQELAFGLTPDTSFVAYIPAPGLYLVRVRALGENGIWSIWRYSTDTLGSGPPWIGERKNK